MRMCVYVDVMCRSAVTLLFVVAISSSSPTVTVQEEQRYVRCSKDPEQTCLTFGSLMVSGDNSLYSDNKLKPTIELAMEKVRDNEMCIEVLAL